jgi:hypothetical protein
MGDGLRPGDWSTHGDGLSHGDWSTQVTGLLGASDPDIAAAAFHGDWSTHGHVAATNFHMVTGLRMNLSRPRIFTW